MRGYVAYIFCSYQKGLSKTLTIFQIGDTSKNSIRQAEILKILMTRGTVFLAPKRPLFKLLRDIQSDLEAHILAKHSPNWAFLLAKYEAPTALEGAHNSVEKVEVTNY